MSSGFFAMTRFTRTPADSSGEYRGRGHSTREREAELGQVAALDGGTEDEEVEGARWGREAAPDAERCRLDAESDEGCRLDGRGTSTVGEPRRRAGKRSHLTGVGGVGGA